jgi:hypothetical protein
MVAKGLYEFQRSERAKSILKPGQDLSDLKIIHSYFDQFFLSRIGIRILIGHYLEMYQEQQPAGELHDDPLRATTRAEDASTTNRICERGGIGRGKVALTKDVGAGNRGTTNESRKITNDRLYFG